MKPFLIIGLPRSMTAWVANWFTYGDSMCYHEGIFDQYKSVSELVDRTKRDGISYGDSNSGLSVGWADEIIKLSKEINIGYIYRDYDEVVESYDKVNVLKDKISTSDIVYHTAHYLDHLLSIVDHCMIRFDEILDMEKFEEFHNKIVPHVEFNKNRYNILRDLNVSQKVEEVYNRKALKWQQ